MEVWDDGGWWGAEVVEVVKSPTEAAGQQQEPQKPLPATLEQCQPEQLQGQGQPCKSREGASPDSAGQAGGNENMRIVARMPGEQEPVSADMRVLEGWSICCCECPC